MVEEVERIIPLKGQSQQLVKGDVALSQKWKTRFDFLFHEAPSQANTVQAMMVHALYPDVWKTVLWIWKQNLAIINTSN